MDRAASASAITHRFLVLRARWLCELSKSVEERASESRIWPQNYNLASLGGPHPSINAALVHLPLQSSFED
jgi:hypothetical protein